MNLHVTKNPEGPEFIALIMASNFFTIPSQLKLL